jgi:ribosome-associated protein
MRIPLNELHITFVRSQGPGGQNVNKTSSKAQLRWSVWDSRAFTSDEKAVIARKLSSYMTWKSEIVLSNEQTRSQLQNKAAVIKRLNDLVSKAVIPATPRIATKPTKSSQRKRIERKVQHSKKKKLRSFIDLFFF